MRTEAKEYSDYLERKYLPGRRQYLSWFFYPRIVRALAGPETIIDLGCGTGEFLRYCRTRQRTVLGVDSNESLVAKNRNGGFEVVLDNICELTSLQSKQFKYAICDNVLEHLEVPEIGRFFLRAGQLIIQNGILICIVPGGRGFQLDPTHKTYVSESLVRQLAASAGWVIQRYYHHPINLNGIDLFFYLNMQVFELKRS